jgi:hypothetical protein
MRLIMAGEEYVASSSRKERSGVAWFKAGIWKLKWIRKYLREEDGPYVVK